MKGEEHKQEADARRFFLGEMSEAERRAFEEDFVADEALFERARVVEDELVEAYARGTLVPAERERFERNFLTSARRRGRVEFTRAMLGRLAEGRGEAAPAKKTGEAAATPSAWDSIVNLFKTPAFAYGAAFALLAVIVGALVLLRGPNRPEVARQITPTPTAQPARATGNETPTAEGNAPVGPNANSPAKIPNDANNSSNAGGATPNVNQPPQTPRRPAETPAPVLALFAGAVRGEGRTPVLKLPQGAQGARLQLHLESRDYKVYRAEVVDPDGAPVFRSGALSASGSIVNLYVPARSLRRGDYLVKLSALNPQKELESVADYSLRITRE